VTWLLCWTAWTNNALIRPIMISRAGGSLSGMWRVHRLDQISAKTPAKLPNSKSLTLDFLRRQIWPVFLPYSYIGPECRNWGCLVGLIPIWEMTKFPPRIPGDNSRPLPRFAATASPVPVGGPAWLSSFSLVGPRRRKPPAAWGIW
jgi:hypothetical protein